MFELSWIDLALIVLLAYAWGRWVQWRIIMGRLLADPQRFADILQEHSQKTPEDVKRIHLRVEWIGSVCYLYRQDTNEFVGQGASAEDAIERAHNLDPACEYTVDKDRVNKPD